MGNQPLEFCLEVPAERSPKTAKRWQGDNALGAPCGTQVEPFQGSGAVSLLWPKPFKLSVLSTGIYGGPRPVAMGAHQFFRSIWTPCWLLLEGNQCGGAPNFETHPETPSPQKETRAPLSVWDHSWFRKVFSFLRQLNDSHPASVTSKQIPK